MPETAPPEGTPPPTLETPEQLLQRLLDKRIAEDEPKGPYGWLSRFASSGFFFMIVGTIFLIAAYQTVGDTHSAMSFVFVVVGVAILLYGTGTQGIGQFDSGRSAEKVAQYKVALAGGAGVLAFCVAAGIVGYSDDIKAAFQVEQRYVKFQIHGKGYQKDDIGRYLPDVRINGTPVAAVRRGDYIEVLAPYIQSRNPARFDIRAKLRLVEPTGGLTETLDEDFSVELDRNGEVKEAGSLGGRYNKGSGYDFPYYRLQKAVVLENTSLRSVDGIVPQ